MPTAQLLAIGPVWTLRQETVPTRSVPCSTIKAPPLSPSTPDSAHPLLSQWGSLQPCHSCGPVAVGSFLRLASQDRSSSITGRRVTWPSMEASLQLTATAATNDKRWQPAAAWGGRISCHALCNATPEKRNVLGDGDAGVPQHLGDHMQRRALGQHQ